MEGLKPASLSGIEFEESRHCAIANEWFVEIAGNDNLERS
jgi:hypothetical protein